MRTAILLGVALLSAGCVMVLPRSRPAAWPAPAAVTDERLTSEFTGSTAALTLTAMELGAAEEMFRRSPGEAGRRVVGLTATLRGDVWSVTVVGHDGERLVREQRIVRTDASVAWHRVARGREGGIAAATRITCRVAPDAAGGLVFEQVTQSVGAIGVLPGAYYERRWWRLERRAEAKKGAGRSPRRRGDQVLPAAQKRNATLL